MQRFRILIVGGAGYVGSSVAAWLLDRGHDLSVVDDLSTGHYGAVERLGLTEKFTRARAGDASVMVPLLRDGRFDAVMHFAASAVVSESVAHPDRYFENNVSQTELLMANMIDADCPRLVFSSTCAVFGDPGGQSLHELLIMNPTSPYGESKRRAEAAIAGSPLQSTILRYFNAAGADRQCRVGEMHDPETHLIPLVLRAARAGKPVSIFGTDYATPDGTCVRDYVHVDDLAAAHELALIRMVEGKQAQVAAYNIGSERGYSVLEVVRAAERVTGQKILTELLARRDGDVPRLLADSALARKELGFQPQHDLDSILATALAWEERSK